MEKKASGKKKGLKWILLAVGILVLAAAIGLGLWFWLGNQQEEAVDDENHLTIYWNVEQAEYVAKGGNGTSGRTRRSDGYYYICLAANGEQENYMVEDFELVNKIDLLNCFVPVFDENGIIVDVRTIDECTGGLVAPLLYVQAVDGNKITANTQGGFLGTTITLELDEETEIYNIGGGTILAGVPATLKFDDQIIAIKDKDGTIGTVYTNPHVEIGDIYYNIYRMYDSLGKVTTRERDELGLFTFEMALNGELVTVRTRDAEVANSIDSWAVKCMCLTFDDNGYAISREPTGLAGAPTAFGSWYNVTEIDNRNVTAKKLAGGSDQGTVVEGVMSSDCKIVDVSPQGGYSGAYTELRLGDQIHGLRDTRGSLCCIFVLARTSSEEMPLYWNVDRQYDYNTQCSSRKPDANGWYYAKVTTGGQRAITVKTQDKALMDQLDGYGTQCFTMRLKGDNEIDYMASATAACGGANSFGSSYYIDSIEGNKIIASTLPTGATERTVITGTLSSNVEIINVSPTNYDKYIGEYTDLHVGDQIYGLMDYNEQIRVLFIKQKATDVPMYWNLTRGYNSTTKETTKKPDANGFYWYTMAVNGEQVKLKTRSKLIADQVDSMSARCMGLDVWNGEITRVHAAHAVRGYSGSTRGISWVYVTKIIGQNINFKNETKTSASYGSTYADYIGNNCKIYDVSNGYMDYAGEPTTLRVGDQVHALHDENGIIMICWVVGGRAKQLNTKPKDCPCAQGVEWEPWDGIAPLKSGHSYYLTNDVLAPDEGFYMEGLEVNLRLDGHTIFSDGRCFYIQTAGKLRICDHGTRGQLVGTGVDGESGGVIRLYSNNETEVSLWNIDVVCAADSTPASQGGAISISGLVSLYDVNVIGGVASSQGGNIKINNAGYLRMFGGSVQGGNVTKGTGGNLCVEGSVYLEDTVVSDGKASGNGDNIYMTNAANEKRFNGLTTSGGDVYVGAGKVGVLGTIKADVTLVSGGSLNNMGLSTDSDIKLTMNSEGVILSNADTDLTGVFTDMSPSSDLKLLYDEKTKEVYKKDTVVLLPHDHCLCGDADLTPDDHTCGSVNWKPLRSSNAGNYFTVSSNRYVPKQKELYLYLPGDLDLTYPINVSKDYTIHLCLNGHKLSVADTSQPVMRVWGNLDIIDCSEGETGSIVGHRTGEAACLYIQNWVSGTNYATPTVNLYAGTLTADDGNTSAQAGVIQLGNKANDTADNHATFNMYGGKICGGDATKGGNVFVNDASGIFNMYGGIITDGNATGNGGGIFLNNAGAKLNLLGGTITGNTASTGDDVYVPSGGNATLGGDIKIGEFYSGNVVLKLQNLLPTASIKLMRSGDGTGVFANGVETDLSACFTNPKLIAKWDSESKTLFFEKSDAPILPPSQDTDHMHCLCADAAGMASSHKCTNAGFVKVMQADFDNATTSSSLVKLSADGKSYTFADGYYYLGENVTIEKFILVEEGANVSICLNGFKLTGSSRKLAVKGTLHLTDCSGTENADGTHSYNGTVSTSGYKYGGAVLYSYADSTTNIYGGNILGDNLPSSITFGGASAYVEGELNIYDGRIADGDVSQSSQQGGNMMVSNSGVINMYGGSIENGKASKSSGGGNMRLNGKFNMYGGKIAGGQAMQGGSVVVGPSGTFNLYDGTVTGGRATEKSGAGGGNFLVFGALNISGGRVENGYSGTNGGNISGFGNKANIKITGGVITGGDCKTGANISMKTTGTTKVYLSITGGKVEGIATGAAGHSVHIDNNAYIFTTVGGNAIVDDLYFAGASAVLTVSTDKPLTEAASVSISAAGEQVVATGVTAVTGLKAKGSDYELTLEGTDLKLTKKA